VLRQRVSIPVQESSTIIDHLLGPTVADILVSTAISIVLAMIISRVVLWAVGSVATKARLAAMHADLAQTNAELLARRAALAGECQALARNIKVLDGEDGRHSDAIQDDFGLPLVDSWARDCNVGIQASTFAGFGSGNAPSVLGAASSLWFECLVSIGQFAIDLFGFDDDTGDRRADRPARRAPGDPGDDRSRSRTTRGIAERFAAGGASGGTSGGSKDATADRFSDHVTVPLPCRPRPIQNAATPAEARHDPVAAALAAMGARA
jgi:uncharacterized membrane protein YgcG